jgi:hypothetical protein
MNNQANTAARELSLEDLDRVSGAGLGIAQHGVRKAGAQVDPQGGGEATLQFEANAAGRGIISI